MNEDKVIGQLRSVGADGIISLPCDKNKLLTDMLHLEFDVVDITREEDAVGISAGMAMAGKRPVISIQSSGLGNMLNAMMSLTGCYRLPMFVLASWRGTESEKIEAQVHFNSRIPELLEVYGIGCSVIESEEDIHLIGEAMKDSFDRSVMNVVLVKPDLWGDSKRLPQDYPTRRRIIPAVQAEEFPEPELTRLEAIKEVMAMVGDDDIVVSNIGVPSKEVHAVRDRPLNFYMLGSYTQATPIGLGLSLSTDRNVFVIDGDGSLLGSSVFSVLSSESPRNLTVVCLDNGTFGSTGNQLEQAYDKVDLASVARSFGLADVRRAHSAEGIRKALSGAGDGMRFVHVPIKAFNSDSPNIRLKAVEIRDRFMSSLGSDLLKS